MIPPPAVDTGWLGISSKVKISILNVIFISASARVSRVIPHYDSSWNIILLMIVIVFGNLILENFKERTTPFDSPASGGHWVARN